MAIPLGRLRSSSALGLFANRSQAALHLVARIVLLKRRKTPICSLANERSSESISPAHRSLS